MKHGFYSVIRHEEEITYYRNSGGLVWRVSTCAPETYWRVSQLPDDAIFIGSLMTCYLKYLDESGKYNGK